MESMSIDCGQCAVRGPGCEDCVVAVLLGFEQPGAAVRKLARPYRSEGLLLDDEQDHALGVLNRGGLLPPLRMVTDGRSRPTG